MTLYETLQKATSEEDVKDYVAAANVLLEKDGLRPLSEEDAFIKWNIIIMLFIYI